ncbi:MAG: DEAD/DEAH box helicase, partial [Nitrososphaerales archaeon]|nr:DEAD/DEAH box helicase [Nitrososphaerales archaeon]
TPLRALNRDVHRRIINYAKIEGLDIKIRHGDTSQTERKKISDSPSDVLITTPETLVVLLSQRKYLSALSDLEWVVIDEIHELLASERGSQLSISMERLQLNSNQEIHRIGLSATVGNISEAGKFLVGNNRKCELIRDKSIRKYDVNIKFVDGGIHEVADGIIDYVNEMKIHSPVLLFTNSRGESETLASVLKERTKIKIDLHHGSLSRQVREETETILRDGTPGIVVCTSSLELGLDLGSIDLVIHYGSPRQVSKFMQRIGRSKHNRDSSAKGLIITNHADDEFETNAIMQRIEESSIEEQKIHDLPFGVLAHHLVGLTKQVGDVSVETAFKMIKQSYPFRNLTIEEFLTVLETLASEYLIFFDREKMSFWDSRGRSFRYHFENLSTIPDILKYKVIDITSKKFVGTLDQRFVGSYGESGNIFVLRGLQWSILNVDKKSLKVNVEPFVGKSKVPYWEGENIPVDYITANKVGKLRTKVKEGLVKLSNKLISELNFDTIPNEKTIVVESVQTEDEIVLHACFGTKINSTIATLLSSLLSSTLAYRVDARSDAYRICLSSKKRISEKHLIDELTSQFDIYNIMTTALKNTNNMNWKTWCVAKQFSIVERGATFSTKDANSIYKQFEDGPIVKEALRELFHDKFDLPNTENILTKIRNKEIIVTWVVNNKFSSLADAILDSTTK